MKYSLFFVSSFDFIFLIGMSYIADSLMLISFFQSNMGAKNHALIMPDANMDAALNAVASAGFGAAGQRCMALGVAIFVGSSKSWYFVWFYIFMNDLSTGLCPLLLHP